MISKEQYQNACRYTMEFFNKAGIVLTEDEKSRIEVADFGLGRLNEIGLELITYVNTDRVCAKELVLMPRQICPEHRHPMVNGAPGKEETFRCRWGKVFLYVPGEPAKNPEGTVPGDMKQYFTVWKEVILLPGEQYTLMPDTLHWFQAGDEGAIVSEFSTKSIDEADIFTDPNIKRAPEIAE